MFFYLIQSGNTVRLVAAENGGNLRRIVDEKLQGDWDIIGEPCGLPTGEEGIIGRITIDDRPKLELKKIDLPSQKPE